MKKILGLFVIAITALTLVACSKGKEFDFEQGYITIGLEADYLPFNWYETTANDYNHPLVGGGFVAGYDVEIAKLIAKGLGLELRIKQIAWDSLNPSLNSNDIDLIIAGMSPTAERKLTIDFTENYYTSNHVVVVKKGGNFTNLETLEDLSSARGQGQKGTIYADLVDFVNTKVGATVLPQADTVSIITTSIINDAADFTIVEKPVALGLVKAFPDKLQIELDVTENIFEVSNEDRDISVGLRKVDTELRDKINAILAGITQTQRDQIMAEAVDRAEVE